MESGIKLEARPQVALADDIVLVTVSGLQSHHDVTLAGLIKGQNMTLISHAHYRADRHGVINLQRHPSLGGSYTGIEPMGFIWSMILDPASKLGARTINIDVTAPFVVHLYLLNGHVNISRQDDITSGQAAILETCRLVRYNMSPDVRRIPLEHPTLLGTLFLPPGTGPFPGVLDLSGGGGLYEVRAAALASRGFATLALAYENYKHLPSDIDTSVEYFEMIIVRCISSVCCSLRFFITGR